ncbi:MAG: transcription antitermination protein NusB [Clostridia bacterium]|nr:transcription antitermination protein NusB [Clostridia bacterium]
MSRIQSRENAFKIIYSKLYVDDAEISPIEEIDDFCTSLVSAFTTNLEDIKQKVEVNLKGVKLERVYKIDLALIYLAIAEIFYTEGSEYKVVINEVVELAKRYSTDNSPKFINGFLAGLVK